MKEGLTPSKIDELLAKIKPRPVVALVDDDAATLDLLERSLHDEGYETHRFEKAEDLLSRISKVRPDVIVMEVVLSGMNGLSALEELHPKTPEEMIPVVILSGKSDPRSKLLAFKRGASDYVTKPFEAEEVAARVHALVRSKLIQEMLISSSISDPLTDLYNRRFLLSWLSRELERVRRYGLDLACLLIDFDSFREFNEKHGERLADHLLREFAGFLNQHTRRADIVGRFENDEFVLFLPSTSKEQAAIVARRLRDLMTKRPLKLGAQKTAPSFSVGIVGCHAAEAPEPKAFLERAEEALGKAKEVGVGETAVLGVA